MRRRRPARAQGPAGVHQGDGGGEPGGRHGGGPPARFCSAFDEVLAPVFATLDGLPAYLDPALASEDFLDWLADWVGLVLNESWSAQRGRGLVDPPAHPTARVGHAGTARPGPGARSVHGGRATAGSAGRRGQARAPATHRRGGGTGRLSPAVLTPRPEGVRRLTPDSQHRPRPDGGASRKVAIRSASPDPGVSGPIVRVVTRAGVVMV